MSDKVRITVLTENSVGTRGLKAEHGLACLVETSGRRVLFDTGQTALLLENAGALGCSLEGLDAIVLSHGHYDHTGGLAAVCRLSPGAQVFVHPAAFKPKFSAQADGSVRDIGMPDPGRQVLADTGRNVVLTTAVQEILPGLFVTGEIPRRTGFEDVGGRFFLDRACTQPDLLTDDQALFLDTREGLVVVLGCAHAGVVNTLEHVQCLCGDRPIHAVLGGLHLGSASEERLQQTITALRAARLGCLAPMHCTGWPATFRLWAAFSGLLRAAGVGAVFEFEQVATLR